MRRARKNRKRIMNKKISPYVGHTLVHSKYLYISDAQVEIRITESKSKKRLMRLIRLCIIGIRKRIKEKKSGHLKDRQSERKKETKTEIRTEDTDTE